MDRVVIRGEGKGYFRLVIYFMSIGSKFHDWIDNNGVTFSNEFILEWHLNFSDLRKNKMADGGFWEKLCLVFALCLYEEESQKKKGRPCSSHLLLPIAALAHICQDPLWPTAWFCHLQGPDKKQKKACHLHWFLIKWSHVPSLQISVSSTTSNKIQVKCNMYHVVSSYTFPLQ